MEHNTLVTDDIIKEIQIILRLFLFIAMYRVSTKFSYNLNVNLWLIGSCE